MASPVPVSGDSVREGTTDRYLGVSVPSPHCSQVQSLFRNSMFDAKLFAAWVNNITVNVVCAPKDLKYCDLELQRKMKLNILGFQSKDLQHMWSLQKSQVAWTGWQDLDWTNPQTLRHSFLQSCKILVTFSEVGVQYHLSEPPPHSSILLILFCKIKKNVCIWVETLPT